MRVSFYGAKKEVNCLKTETKNFLLEKKTLLCIPLVWSQDAQFCPLRPFPFLSLIAWSFHGYRP